MQDNKTFNFKENTVEVLSLDMLKRTYQEINPMTNIPIRGILHFQLIDKVMELASANNLDCHVEEIFAATSKDKNMPGVIVAPHLAQQYGDNAIEAHCLRRIYTTLRINDGENDESNTGLVIAYHQDGIQIAIGPNIKMCHNQCILSPERMLSNYGGDSKVKDFDKMFSIVDDWMKNFHDDRTRDLEIIEAMKAVQCEYRDVAELIGHMNMFRVGVDFRLIDEQKYPLNQGQISTFTENYLRRFKALKTKGENTSMSLYDIYNIGTEMYKPDQMLIPAILPQNMALTSLLVDHYNL